MERCDVIKLIQCALEEVQLDLSSPVPAPVEEATLLLGPQGCVDSLGLLVLVMAVEDQLFVQHGVTLNLVDARALSATESPFRSVGTLADTVLLRALEVRRG